MEKKEEASVIELLSSVLVMSNLLICEPMSATSVQESWLEFPME